jgi:hypothetical protein
LEIPLSQDRYGVSPGLKTGQDAVSLVTGECDTVPSIAVLIAVAATMVLTSVLKATEVGALTEICPTVLACAFS